MARTRRRYPSLIALSCILALPGTAREALAQDDEHGTRCDDTSALGAPVCNPQSGAASVPSDPRAVRHVGNPVEIATGNKYESATDYRSLSSPLQFRRHYNSALADANGGLGHGWRHEFDVTLARLDATTLLIEQGDGRRIAFAHDDMSEGDRVWRAFSPIDGHVRVAAGGYDWRPADGRRLHFVNGRLAHIDFPHDGRLTLLYRRGRLERVRDDDGTTLDLDWKDGRIGLPRWGADPGTDADAVPAGHLAGLVLPDGSRIEFRYSDAHTLIGTSRRLGASVAPLARYGYDDPLLERHLTSVTRRSPTPIERAAPSEFVETRRWRYDDVGRAVAQTDAQGVDLFTIERTRDSATVTHADGRRERHAWRESHPIPGSSLGGRLVYDAGGHDAGGHDAMARDEMIRDDRASFDRSTAPNAARTVSPPSASGTLDLLPRLQPVPGSLDAVAIGDDGTSVRFVANHDGRVRDLLLGEYRLAELRRRAYPSDHAYCSEMPDDADLLERAAGGHRLCPADIAALDRLRGGAARYALRGRTLRRGGLFDRDPFCELPENMDCAQLRNHYAMAQLSACVYRDGEACAPGFQYIDPLALGLFREEFTVGRFHAELFRDGNTNRHVLVFRGTDAFNDMRDNIGQGLGITAGQYEQAMALAERVEFALHQNDPSATLEFAGHSLGGGLATAAAMDRRLTATVFNPSEVSIVTAALNRFEYFDANNRVEVLRVPSEIVGVLTHVFGPTGNTTTIGRPPDVRAWEWIDAHSMDTVLSSLRIYLHRHCNTTP